MRQLVIAAQPNPFAARVTVVCLVEVLRTWVQVDCSEHEFRSVARAQVFLRRVRRWCAHESVTQSVVLGTPGRVIRSDWGR